MNTYEYDLYDLQQAKVIDSTKFLAFKKILFKWFVPLFNCERFNTKVVREDIITSQHKTLILDCTFELLDMLYEYFEHKLSTAKLQAIAAACFMIAIKLFYSYDHINSRQLSSLLVYAGAGSFTLKTLLELEADILRKTDWKGCNLFSIDKFYLTNTNELMHLDPSVFNIGKNRKNKKRKSKKSKKSTKKT